MATSTITWKLALFEATADVLTLFLYDSAGNIVSGPDGGPVAGVVMAESLGGGNFTCDTTVDSSDMQAVVKVSGNAVAEDTLFAGSTVVGIQGGTDLSLQKLAASGATGTVESVNNANGTFTLTFKDTDGITTLATSTYTTATGDRTRNS